MEDKRIGIIGIIVENLESVGAVNNVIHSFNNLVIGRMGVPYRERNISVISLIVEGTSDEVSAFTGKLGRIPHISVKSALAKK
ncbi:TM1266 family iron-only hydrogenase system putative regulator [Clostridium cellulovorans]|uniref:Transcription factor NikR nickel binding C-terminal domain-containing protein n=1 Tax=Clostridium cellulovorans (strain ATCC 35296 / DSM 3052 / OCM 3 / 743B) TaxID=573061 RepID=D9SVP9_CLOC7|nr:TM1266 family iron-only hydrogenase system putative regulator [Clostridium cellulovorans]ADL53110.1 hypothetical protein Clocel_3432 [Clostridium cellulovorans 743B]